MTVTADHIKYSSAPPSPELAKRVFRLYERLYGDPHNFIRRWEWEFMQHPRSREIVLHCAEMDGELIGFSARHPVSITHRGTLLTASFASNSMVAPEMRGKGVVRELYRLAAESGEVQFSKGTTPAMYNILINIGYKDIYPNTFQHYYLRPFRLLLKRIISTSGPKKPLEFKPADSDEMQKVTSLPDDIGTIVAPDGIIKSAEYLRWRYLEIPHKTYLLFVRRESDKPVSLLVLRSEGTTVYLVDIIWDRKQRNEPAATLAFAKKAAFRMGAYKLKAWCTFSAIRNSLSSLNFRDKGMTPRFTYFCADPSLEMEWQDLNFVHGDGDIDYL